MTSARRHLSQLSQIALTVAACDLATKFAATAALSAAPVILTDWLRLSLVHNSQGAFGVPMGEYARQLNLALTLSAIALMVPVTRDLSRIDRWAPMSLGLIVGAALGNLTSLILSARGVVDFIAVRTGEASHLVLNVADIAAYAGMALLCRTAYLLVARIRADVPDQADSTPALALHVRPLRLVRGDYEIVVPLAAEPGIAVPAMVKPANKGGSPRLNPGHGPTAPLGSATGPAGRGLGDSASV